VQSIARDMLDCNSGRKLQEDLFVKDEHTNVVEISAAPKDEIHKNVPCVPTDPEASYCSLVEAGFTIAGSKESMEKEKLHALGLIKESMEDGSYLQSDLMSNLVAVSYLGPRSISVNEIKVQEEIKIQTPSLKTPISLGVFVGGMLIIVFLFGSKTDRDANRMFNDHMPVNENRFISNVSTEPDVIQHESVIATENHPLSEICMDNSFQQSQISDMVDLDFEENDYVPPSIHDLSRIHSRTDVHRCASATCALCSRTQESNPLFVLAEPCQHHIFDDMCT